MLLALAIVVLALVLFLVVMMIFIKAFLSNVIIVDGILTGIAAGVACGILGGWHPVFCILMGAAVCAVFVMLHVFKIGFWVIAPLMSLAWAGLFGMITYEFSQRDWIWTIAIGCAAAAGVMALHVSARRKILPPPDIKLEEPSKEEVPPDKQEHAE